ELLVSKHATNPEELVATLVQRRLSAEQQTFLQTIPNEPNQALIEAISTRIRELLPRDPELAQSLAETNLYVASLIDTPLAWAFANRSRAHVFYTMRRSLDAETHFEKAVQLFQKAGVPGEVGRTLVGQIDNLMYLSRYPEALEKAKHARLALQEANDVAYLAVLEIALGNLYYRLNKYSDSLAHYDSAKALLHDSDNVLGVASIGLNRAYVLTEMNRFDEALQSFELTKEHCERNGLTLWAA